MGTLVIPIDTKGALAICLLISRVSEVYVGPSIQSRWQMDVDWK